jgi:hypothetical protein
VNRKPLKAPDGSQPIETLENGTVVWARNRKGEPVCNSRLRDKPGKRCQITTALFKNGRCLLHGGKNPRGMAHPSYKDGRLSRYIDVLPPALKNAVLAVDDEDYLSLRQEIVVTAGRVRLHLSAYGEIDQEAVSKLTKAAEYAEELLDGEYDETELEAQLRLLVSGIKDVQKLTESGKTVERTQEHLRRLVETEAKRIQGEHEQISALKAQAIFTFLCDSVRREVWGFVRWLEREFPEVKRHPAFTNPVFPIAADIEKVWPKALPEGDTHAPS